MKVESIELLPHIIEDYSYFSRVHNRYIYADKYDVTLKITPSFEIKPIAFACSSANPKDLMFDYSIYARNCVEQNMSINDIFSFFTTINYQYNVHAYRIKNLKKDDAIQIIKRNIIALNNLNTYLVEQQLIQQVKAM